MSSPKKFIAILALFSSITSLRAQNSSFKVIGFYTGINDPAHVSFVHEANRWLSETAKQYSFQYDPTNNWSNLNTQFLSNYQVVLFLDTRPEDSLQRVAFETYMKSGGGWIGFHFAGFALTPSSYPQNWNWYHNEFIKAGQYKGNTWKPTPAILRVEDTTHPAIKGLPGTFLSAPNEWYSWEKDLQSDKDIRVLLSIDPASFPLGTGPKPHEIWHSGYYPVAWTNKKYRMIYINMGHNDMDYGKTNLPLSWQFDNSFYRQLILQSLLWLGKGD